MGENESKAGKGEAEEKATILPASVMAVICR